jgi:multidrug efflux pump
MELSEEFLQGPETLRNFNVMSSAGLAVPLTSLARNTITTAPLSVNHQSGTPASTISFDLPLGGTLSAATDAVTDAVAELGVPVSMRGTFQGTAKGFKDSLSSQPMLILAALVTIYLVLGILYESLIHPITILSTLPSAGVGALLALMLFKTEFSLIAMIGVILADRHRQKERHHDDRLRHCPPARHPGTQRRRPFTAPHSCAAPILMTTAAALLGALPLAVGRGDGAELRQPLGIAVVGGLVLSQLLTLYTTPVVYVLMDKLRWRKRKQATASQLAEPAHVAPLLAP